MQTERANPNGTIALYVSSLTLLYGLTAPSGIAAIPIQFLLKEQMHLKPEAIALFGFVTGIPLYMAFLFGFLRDRWNPMGKGDRSYFLLFAPLAAATYIWLALGHNSYGRLVIGGFTVTVLFGFLASASQGLIAATAKQRQMTGTVSTLWKSVATLPAVITPLLGGWLTSRMPAAPIFLLVAALTLLLFGIGLWKPKAVFEGIPERKQAGHPLREVTRLIGHRPLWPAVAICCLWQFAPGLQTPLFFYLTDTVKLSSSAYGLFNATFGAAFLPTMILYGMLCRRVQVSKLLLWGTLVAIPEMLLLLFIHSALQAMVCAALMGLMGGVAAVAYWDLLIRSCPEGLEGTGMMLGSAVNMMVIRGGDVVGTWLYERSGFVWCVVTTVGVCALILPMLALIRRANQIQGNNASEAAEAERGRTSPAPCPVA